MRYLGERLAAAGFRVKGVKLAGHAGAPEELAGKTYDNWYESVVLGFEELRGYGDPNVVCGLSMGAVLAARLACDQRESIAGIALLSPAFFLPTVPTYALKALSLLGGLTNRLFVYTDTGSDSSTTPRLPNKSEVRRPAHRCWDHRTCPIHDRQRTDLREWHPLVRR